MAKVNISQAARLTGKSRTTIHRKLNSGELSIQGGLIDTSDLIRVFGALVSESEQSSTGTHRTKRVNTEQVTVQQQVQLEVLQAKFEGLARESALKDTIIESLREQVRLLEHKPTESKPVHQEQRQRDREKEGRLIKFGRFLFDS